MWGTTASGTESGEAPLLVRLGGKLVLEVLPAALASAIGAFLFAQYQFNRAPAASPVTPAVAVPASAEMLQVVREEHALIRDFLTAQRTAEQNRAAAANVADARAAADATPTAAVPTQVALLPDTPKAPAPRHRTVVAAAALPPITVTGVRPAPAAPVVVASAQPVATVLVAAPASVGATPQQPDAGSWPVQPPPARPSMVAQTLAVPGHVMSATLHVVMAIGGIPSWFGHRFGDDGGSAALPPSSAS